MPLVIRNVTGMTLNTSFPSLDNEDVDIQGHDLPFFCHTFSVLVKILIYSNIFNNFIKSVYYLTLG